MSDIMKIYKKEKIKQNIGLPFIVILFITVLMTLPSAAQYLNRAGITMAFLSILSATLALLTLVYYGLYQIPVYTVGFFLCFTIWTILSTIVYNNYLFISRETQTLFGFQVNSYAAFFPNLWILIFPFILYGYIFSSNNKAQKILEIYIVICLVVNFVLLVSAIMIYPNMVRASKTAETLGYGNYVQNLVNYSEVYGLTLIVPAIARKYDNSKGKNKLISFVVLISVITMAIISNFATAGILAVVGFLAYRIFNMHKRKKWPLVFLLAMLAIIFSSFAGQVLLDFSDMLGTNNVWGLKFHEIGIFIVSGVGIGDIGTRSQLYSKSLKSFFESPFLGAIFNNTCQIGGHSTLFDIAGSLGIIGMMFFLGAVYFCYKECINTVYYHANKADINATLLVFILMLLLKNTITSYAIYAIYFGILPVYYKLWQPPGQLSEEFK